MSARWTLNLKCDRCPQLFHGEAAVDPNTYGPVIQRIRHRAEQAGWSFHRAARGRHIDLCPGCVDKTTKQ